MPGWQSGNALAIAKPLAEEAIEQTGLEPTYEI